MCSLQLLCEFYGTVILFSKKSLIKIEKKTAENEAVKLKNSYNPVGDVSAVSLDFLYEMRQNYKRNALNALKFSSNISAFLCIVIWDFCIEQVL